MRGILGDLFDLNCDGEVDSFEQAIELEFLANIEEDETSDDDLPNGGMGEGAYFEPANYFPEELRRKYRLGEFAEEE